MGPSRRLGSIALGGNVKRPTGIRTRWNWTNCDENLRKTRSVDEQRAGFVEARRRLEERQDENDENLQTQENSWKRTKKLPDGYPYPEKNLKTCYHSELVPCRVTLAYILDKSPWMKTSAEHSISQHARSMLVSISFKVLQGLDMHSTCHHSCCCMP